MTFRELIDALRSPEGLILSGEHVETASVERIEYRQTPVEKQGHLNGVRREFQSGPTIEIIATLRDGRRLTETYPVESWQPVYYHGSVPVAPRRVCVG